MTSFTITFGDEKKTWTKITEYLRSNPQILYKGAPIALLAYLSLPYALLFIKWLPWMWAGYEVYHRLPSEGISALWSAIQTYQKR